MTVRKYNPGPEWLAKSIQANIPDIAGAQVAIFHRRCRFGGEGIINMRIPRASGTYGNTNPASPMAINGQ